MRLRRATRCDGRAEGVTVGEGRGTLLVVLAVAEDQIQGAVAVEVALVVALQVRRARET